MIRGRRLTKLLLPSLLAALLVGLGTLRWREASRPILPPSASRAARTTTEAPKAGEGPEVIAEHTSTDEKAAQQTSSAPSITETKSKARTIPAAAGEAEPTPYTAPASDRKLSPAEKPQTTGPTELAQAPGPAGPERKTSVPTESAISKDLQPAPEEVAPSSQGVSRNRIPRATVSTGPPAPEPVPETTAGEKEPTPHSAVSGRLRVAWTAQEVRAIRFDCGYYYGLGYDARGLADELTASWAEAGVNLVYFYAYNKVYGARYRTTYIHNIMEDFGRQDLLGHMLTYAHTRGIKVIAWIYGYQHKQAWLAHPEWREKKANGQDYRPDGESYFLCPRNPEAAQYLLGLIDELLRNYPELDGIDIAEPQIDLWGDEACHCAVCRADFAEVHPGRPAQGPAWRSFRARSLTGLLLANSRLVHSYDREMHITTTLTARPDGTLMDSSDVRDATGFDLQKVLNHADRPDVLQGELIWQQWAAIYGDRTTFIPDWTSAAVEEAKAIIGGRTRFIAHIELSDFGVGPLDGPQLGETVVAAVRGDPDGIDIYDAYLLDQTAGGADYLQTAWVTF